MGHVSMILRLFCSFSIHAMLLLRLECIATAIATASFHEGETDRLALLAIKSQITHDPLGVTNSWNNSLHFCEWQGITCGRRHRRVTILDLRNRSLEGSISPAVGNLTFLGRVSLPNNSLGGEIPNEVGRLFRLKHFDLRNNSFKGEISVNLSRCYNLQTLHLSMNKLEGKIPIELGSLSKLIHLTFYTNQLTGEIPPSFGNLSSLELLDLTYNGLGGRIPDSLGQLKRLISLYLGANRFSGMIPPSLYNVSSMVNFSVADNQLSGTLLPEIGLLLPNLQGFYFGSNQFSGPIPVSLFNASGLQLIDIVNNSFTGGVPTNVGSLKSLQILQVGQNNLGNGKANELSFLTALTNCSLLSLLDIGYNDFGGMLPKSIANLSNQLSSLSLDYNQIYGSIPEGIESLGNLNRLSMGQNILTGEIPLAIGMLKNLRVLNLLGNGFSGKIPSSLGNISQLFYLDLSSNILNGSIPSHLGNCRFLLTLDLSQNNLFGTVPEKVMDLSSLVSLSLAENSLAGSLPLEVGNLEHIEDLDVSNNRISGRIPSELGSCLSLEHLYMEENFFQGFIPSFFSSLKNLQALDLSRNNLSGPIPKTIANLSLLQNLNLSFNSLDGEVPVDGIFKNTSAISIIGNKNLCGGIPKLQLPACSIEESKRRGRSISFKVIITIVSVILSLFLVTAFLIFYYRRKQTKKPSSSTSLRERYFRVSYNDLLKATAGFATENLIGVGSFGSVYKGILRQIELPIAVKVLNLQEQGASKSFMAECEALREIRHRNLLKILTSCSSVDFHGNDFKALVFNFMPNGSLENWLHQSANGQHILNKLSFGQRLSIAIDVASALDYLHHHCQTPIVHRDLKPSNVLLDDDMTAHVGDFGLAKFLSKPTNYSGKNETSSVAIKGSIGYLPPEYGMGGKVSSQGDVYSYGILLLEMFTGKRPIDDLFKDGLTIHRFCKIALPEKVMEVVDPYLLLGEEDEAVTNRENQSSQRGRIQECLVSIVRIGVACSMESPDERMDAKDVITELLVIKEMFAATGIHRER